jgi:hypothetical protein
VSRQGLRIFVFTTASRPIPEPTQSPIQCVLFLGVKRPGRKADHSPPSRAEIKEYVKLFLHYPIRLRDVGAQLKLWDNFTFALIYLILSTVKLSMCVLNALVMYINHRRLHHFTSYINVIQVAKQTNKVRELVWKLFYR